MNIEVKDLHRSFGDLEVLRGVDMKIDSGGVHVILGGSGAGKSVLLKHMIGLLRPDSGEILVDGQDITKLHERAMYPIRRRMSFIFQGGALLNSLTVGANVALALRERRLKPRQEIRDIVDEKLEMVGLGGRARQMPGTLSGGQRKRVALARALATDPEVLFYDEPTAGLDPPTAASIDNLIRDVSDKTHTTSVVVTHDMISVFEIADMIHMLHKGKIIFEGTQDDLGNCYDERVREFLARDTGGARLGMCNSGEFRAIVEDIKTKRSS